jgi:hypothetical protein
VSDPSPFAVEYDFSRRDYLHFSFHSQIRSPFLWVMASLAPILLIVTTFNAIADGTSPLVRVIIVLAAAGVAGLIAVCLIALSVAVTVWFQPGVRTLLGWKRVTLTEEALLSEAKFIKVENLWKGIRKIVRSKHYLLIYNTALSAYVIPRRAFASVEDWDRFYEFARHRFETSHQPASPQVTDTGL